MVASPQDRSGTAKTLVESFGGKLHHYYFAFGEYNGIGICEFPDAVAAFSMAATSTGAFSRFETTSLLTGRKHRKR
jgi:uncharacterized protein with GYD domain